MCLSWITGAYEGSVCLSKHGTVSFWRQMIHDVISSCKSLNTEHFLQVLAIHDRDWGQPKVESRLLNVHCDFGTGAASWEGMWAAFRGIEQPFSPLLKKNLNSTVSRKRSAGDSHIGELLPGLHTEPTPVSFLLDSGYRIQQPPISSCLHFWPTELWAYDLVWFA